MRPSDPQTQLNSQPNTHQIQGIVPTKTSRKQALVNLFTHLPLSKRSWIGILLLGGVGIMGWGLLTKSDRVHKSNKFNLPISPGIRVQLATAKTATVTDITEFIGSLAPARSQIIKPPSPGVVMRILVQPGDRVKQGTPIMQIDPQAKNSFLSLNRNEFLKLSDGNFSRSQGKVKSDLNFDHQLAKLSVLEAEQASRRADVGFYQREVEKYTQFVIQGKVSRKTRDGYATKLKNAKTALEKVNSRIQDYQKTAKPNPNHSSNLDLTNITDITRNKTYDIKAPFTGNIQEISVRMGDYVKTDEPLVNLAQTRPLELQIYVPIDRIPQLHQGMTIEILDDQGKKIGTSRIITIATGKKYSPDLVLVTALYDDLQTDNSQEKIEAPSFTRTRIIWKEYPGVMIPQQAIANIDGQSVVYVVESQSNHRLISRQRKIQLGSLQGENYQVTSGLQPGEKIIMTNLAKLRDGDPIVIDRN